MNKVEKKRKKATSERTNGRLRVENEARRNGGRSTEISNLAREGKPRTRASIASRSRSNENEERATSWGRQKRGKSAEARVRPRKKTNSEAEDQKGSTVEMGRRRARAHSHTEDPNGMRIQGFYPQSDARGASERRALIETISGLT